MTVSRQPRPPLRGRWGLTAIGPLRAGRPRAHPATEKVDTGDPPPGRVRRRLRGWLASPHLAALAGIPSGSSAESEARGRSYRSDLAAAVPGLPTRLPSG